MRSPSTPQIDCGYTGGRGDRKYLPQTTGNVSNHPYTKLFLAEHPAGFHINPVLGRYALCARGFSMRIVSRDPERVSEYLTGPVAVPADPYGGLRWSGIRTGYRRGGGGGRISIGMTPETRYRPGNRSRTIIHNTINYPKSVWHSKMSVGSVSQNPGTPSSEKSNALT